MQHVHRGSSTKMTILFKSFVNDASKALLPEAAHQRPMVRLILVWHNTAQHSTAQHTGRVLLFKPFGETAPEALPGDLLSAKAAIGLQQG